MEIPGSSLVGTAIKVHNKNERLSMMARAPFIISARNAASPCVSPWLANLHPSARTASAATLGPVWTSQIFSPSFLTFFSCSTRASLSLSLLLLSLSFYTAHSFPNHWSDHSLPPRRLLLPHYIARCAFCIFLGRRNGTFWDQEKRKRKNTSPWRAPRIKRPTRRTCPAGRTPSTTREPGSCWVVLPAAGVRIPVTQQSISGRALTFTELIPNLIFIFKAFIATCLFGIKPPINVFVWMDLNECHIDGWEAITGLCEGVKGEACTKRLAKINDAIRGVQQSVSAA